MTGDTEVTVQIRRCHKLALFVRLPPSGKLVYIQLKKYTAILKLGPVTLQPVIATKREALPNGAVFSGPPVGGGSSATSDECREVFMLLMAVVGPKFHAKLRHED
jgi:hypothetical protein